ncbi:HD-GYP domain-containing protein [Armatimonas sp.]|uniref:HD-GYP domain-containing protein n=1 Tax=Armatimonas sp. TaxID=1872638 RepID=UPI00286D47C5|nr:HD-GYP domain-containing protein [Armatimonas sp.]
MTERLPKTAIAYIATITLLALGAVVDSYLRQPLATQDIKFLPVLIIIGMFSGSLRVPLTSHKKGHSVAYTNLGFITTIISLLVYGPFFGVIVGASTFITFKRIKTEFYKKLFNISAIIVTVWITSHFLILAKYLNLSIEENFKNDNKSNIIPSIAFTGILLISVLCHHTINSLFITGAISTSLKWSKKRALEFLVNSTVWTIPTYLAAGCFVIMSTWIFTKIQGGHYNAIPLLLSIIPLPFFYFNNLQLHRERDEERENRFQELESLYSSLVQAMGRAIEAKDRYTKEHIGRVVAMSLAIGQQLGLSEDKLRALEVGAALHDIGKIAIPDTVLNKPGKLTPEEFDLIKEHAALGSDILQPIPFPPEVVEAVRHHHEKWDGTGYPDKLIGEKIPFVARIVAVADVYDALTSDRPYRAAWSHQKTMEFMESQVGTHFNAEVFTAFKVAMLTNPEMCSQAIDPPPSVLRLAA